MATQAETNELQITIAAAHVLPPKVRRRWSVGEKRRIVELAAACPRGELGALLRREKIYSTQLATWRRELGPGGTGKAMSRKKPTDTKSEGSASSKGEVVHLRQEIDRLTETLRRMELVLSIQKKVAALCKHARLPDVPI